MQPMTRPRWTRRFHFSHLLLLSMLLATQALALPAPTGQPGDFGFGIAVALPGDLNGDSKADFVCGATTFDIQGDFTPGRVYVFSGGPGLDGTHDFVLVGESPGDRFGYVLAGAGDVNGDTYPDLVVGAYQNDTAGSNAGAAYVFFGGPAFDSTPDLTIRGEKPGDNFGIAVDGIGDVNGDTYDDLLIGARFHSEVGSENGRAYVFFGGPTLDNAADLLLDGNTPAERLGFTVSRAGDVNDDTYPDFLVGAYHNSSQDFETGRVYVYFGGPGLDNAFDLILDGDGFRAHFSDALAASDVNGDNEPDILVGASQYDLAKGRAYVYFGGAGLDAIADRVLDPGIPGDWFGRCMAGGGDLDGDGFGDLVVGAPARQNDGAGRAYIYFGGAAFDGTHDAILYGESPTDNFGWSAAANPADLDDNLSHEFVVGGFNNDHAGFQLGRAYVFSLSGTVPITVTDLTAAADGGSIVLSWSMAAAALPEIAAVQVERAEDFEGPYEERGGTALVPETAMRFTDPEVESGRSYWYRIACRDWQGRTEWASPIQVRVDTDLRTRLHQPAMSTNGPIAIRYSIGASGAPIELGIYDVQGRRVRQLENGPRSRGEHLSTWDRLDDRGESVAPGIYFVLLRAGQAKDAQKLVLLRN